VPSLLLPAANACRLVELRCKRGLAFSRIRGSCWRRRRSRAFSRGASCTTAACRRASSQQLVVKVLPAAHFDVGLLHILRSFWAAKRRRPAAFQRPGVMLVTLSQALRGDFDQLHGAIAAHGDEGRRRRAKTCIQHPVVVRAWVQHLFAASESMARTVLSLQPKAIFLPSCDQLTPLTVSKVIGIDNRSFRFDTSQT